MTANTDIKSLIREAIWTVGKTHDEIVSVTLVGSFTSGEGLDGISDIDTIVIVDSLSKRSFDLICESFRQRVSPVVEQAGYSLRINPTLGPLKFNDARTAVLHLMFYTRETHRRHVISSPFTCLDWQNSPIFIKESLRSVYPAWRLQPRHFLGARRSPKEYLGDFLKSRIGYRKYEFDQNGHSEVLCYQEMSTRDRHEFAYHIMKFLMSNLCKLVQRMDEAPCSEDLPQEYFRSFPAGEREFTRLFRLLESKKHSLDFEEPVIRLDEIVISFVEEFQRQFEQEFVTDSTVHLAVRHAPTSMNLLPSGGVVFQGCRSNPSILPPDPAALEALAESLSGHKIEKAICSPLARAMETIDAVSRFLDFEMVKHVDQRLTEMDYGDLDGSRLETAKAMCPGLFAAWGRGEDPPFPGGECSLDVSRRVLPCIEEHLHAAAPAGVLVTHNVVLRVLTGQSLGVPMSDWYRIKIPHLEPLRIVSTKRFGIFVDLDSNQESDMFSGFASPGGGVER